MSEDARRHIAATAWALPTQEQPAAHPTVRHVPRKPDATPAERHIRRKPYAVPQRSTNEQEVSDA